MYVSDHNIQYYITRCTMLVITLNHIKKPHSPQQLLWVSEKKPDQLINGNSYCIDIEKHLHACDGPRTDNCFRSHLVFTFQFTTKF